MDANNALRETIVNMMKNGSYKLKPCPFCGGDAEFDSQTFFEGLDTENGRACIGVKCKACNVVLTDHTSDEHDYFVRTFIVAEKWNRRVE